MNFQCRIDPRDRVFRVSPPSVCPEILTAPILIVLLSFNSYAPFQALSFGFEQKDIILLSGEVSATL